MKKQIPFWAGAGIVIVAAVITGMVVYYRAGLSLQPSGSGAAPAPPSAASSSSAYPITYTNDTYGFTFSLPADWQGYTIVTSAWNGTGDEACPANGCPPVTGPTILIRNPQWTSADPWQDIPIMVFTHSEWDAVATTSPTLIVSAAPIPPSELGENADYVFALPARYNYAFPNGWQEVQSIVASDSLHAF